MFVYYSMVLITITLIIILMFLLIVILCRKFYHDRLYLLCIPNCLKCFKIFQEEKSREGAPHPR